jgi:hypothetical protein
MMCAHHVLLSSTEDIATLLAVVKSCVLGKCVQLFVIAGPVEPSMQCPCDEDGMQENDAYTAASQESLLLYYVCC